MVGDPAVERELGIHDEPLRDVSLFGIEPHDAANLEALDAAGVALRSWSLPVLDFYDEPIADTFYKRDPRRKRGLSVSFGQRTRRRRS